ncbi:MAG: two-component regulator propeller domain-containing protein [Lysobacterales bacterium]
MLASGRRGDYDAAMRNLARLLAVSCLLLACRAHAVPQLAPYFETVGDGESIPDNNVSALAQDESGFIWIGTPAGLLRYDGYRFRSFAGDDGDARSLAGDFVRSLLSGSDGRLWIGTNADGVAVLDANGARVTRVRAAADGLSSNTVRALAEDAGGGVWIGTREGLDYWPPGETGIRHYRQRFGGAGDVDDDHITALLVDVRGNLWVGSWGGLSVRRPNAESFDRISSLGAASDPSDRVQVQSLLQLGDGTLIIGTARSGSFALAPDAPVLRPIPVGADNRSAVQPAVLSLLEPRPGILWIGVFGGIDVLDAHDFRLLRQIRPDTAVASSLAHDQIRCMLRDQAGEIWVGGYGGGLQRHNPANDGIGVLRHSPGRPGTLSTPSVSSVLEVDDGRIWIGTRGNGIDLWDRQQGVIGGWRPYPDDPKALRNGVISSLAQSADGTIWVGTVDGLHQYQRDSNEFVWWGPDQGLPDVYVRRLLATAVGDLWIGTDAGLARRRAGRAVIEQLRAIDNAPVRADVNALVEAADGGLWVGSSTGLYRVDAGEDRLRQIRIRAVDGSAMDQVSVLGLLLDRSDQLWADTPVGLHRVRWSGPDLAVLEPVALRPGQTARPFGANLLEDPLGRIWSQRFVYDPKADSLYELSRADGADLGTAWFRSYTQTRDGTLLFGGSKGLMVVNPREFSPWQYQPPIVATELQLGGVPAAMGPAAAGFNVNPEQRGFALEFAALDFSSPLRLRYQYRLDGFDRDWIETDATRRVASYNSLSPGEYLLRVRGSARTGVMSPHELRIPVQVIPAVWQTWWFRTLVVLASLLLLLGLRMREHGLRRRSARLETLVAERTAELTQAKEGAETALQQLQNAQIELVAREKMASLGQLVAGVAHEINTPVGVALTASSYLAERSAALGEALEANELRRTTLAEFAAQASNASQIIHQNLARASELVRNFKQVSVDRSKDDRRQFDLAQNLAAVVSSLEITWKRRPITLRLECADDILLDSYPGALGQVISNLIQNALLHAFPEDRAGHMRLSASLTPAGLVQVVFEDNGAGIGSEELARVFEPFYTTRRAQGGSGLGLHIVYNLVTVQLGGRVAVEGAPNVGMRFQLTFPRVAP